MEALNNKIQSELMENFEMMRIFKGKIDSIKIKPKNGSQIKILFIQSVKEINKTTGKFNPIFNNFQSFDNEIIVKIKLKKKWAKLDLYEGLEIIFIGELKTSKNNPFSFSFTIPSKNYKTSHIFNIMVVEPSM